MKRNTLSRVWLSRACLACSLVVLAMASRTIAGGLPTKINFSGSAQDFNVTESLNGSVFIDGGGVNYLGAPFAFTPPLNHAVSLKTSVDFPAKATSDPITSSAGGTFYAWPNYLVDIDQLNLDFLKTMSVAFEIAPVTIFTDSEDIFFRTIQWKLSGSLSALGFSQTGAPQVQVFSNGGYLGTGTGAYKIPGTLTGTISSLVQSFGLAGSAPSIPQAIGDQSFAVPFFLTGDWRIDPVAAFFPKLSLDGKLNAAIPLSIETGFGIDLTSPLKLAMTATADLLNTLSISGTYHLEQRLNLAPEPGSIVLLAIGLTFVAGLAEVRKRWRGIPSG